MRPIDFDKCFQRLTGKQPFHWQSQLFQRFIQGDFPDACDIPTGLGKTLVVAVWLLALGCSQNPKERLIPLRLVYVVDRRVIVDQASDEAAKLVLELKKASLDSSDPLHEVAINLRNISMTGTEDLVALSPMRGEKADNREWCLDPSRPAIIISTVDMAGSRLLFSGYGKVGINHRSLQAGLLGQDALFVVDEAHLSPCFLTTLQEVRSLLTARSQILRPFHIITLSATQSGEASRTLTIDKETELKNAIARKRLTAKKILRLTPYSQSQLKEGKQSAKAHDEILSNAIVENALKFEQPDNTSTGRSVIIFVRTVSLVNSIALKLAKAISEHQNGASNKSVDNRILKMTGEMRAFERDLRFLTENPKFRRFLPNRDRTETRQTYYLIATSCAEVGIDLDADDGVCDLTSLDSMIQRIGRVNRFGETSSTIVVLVDQDGIRQFEANQEPSLKDVKTTTKKQQGELAFPSLGPESPNPAGKNTDQHPQQKSLPVSDITYYTWKTLSKYADSSGSVSASPLELRAMLGDSRAVPRAPVRPPLDPARVDDWSFTTLKNSEYKRPLVHYWLRGVENNDQTETAFVWRAELDQMDITDEALAEIVAALPIQPRERLKMATFRAVEYLTAVGKKRPFSETRVVLITPDGEHQVMLFNRLVDEQDSLFLRLASSVVVFPCSLGGIDQDGNATMNDKEAEKASDVAGFQGTTPQPFRWQRFHIFSNIDGTFQISQKDITEGAPDADTGKTLTQTLKLRKASGVIVNTPQIQAFFNKQLSKQPGSYHYIAICLSRNDTPTVIDVDTLLRDDPDELGSLGQKTITVNQHDQDVKKYAAILSGKIGLDDDLSLALSEAGENHDLGKERTWWQQAIGNTDRTPYAKSATNFFNHEINQGYRHEFGSLIDVLNNQATLKARDRDLVFHLIASHHGYGRPLFPERAFDRDLPKPVNQEIAWAAMLRFERLQRRYGWWQLAYLEAILKAADALASRDFIRGTL